MPEALLEAEGVVAGYTEEPVVAGISLRAEQGRITGIIGPNGCGKSTFLKAIVGIVRPTGGRIVLRGEDVTRLSPFQTLQKGLAYIPQGRQVFPDMTVQENLQMAAYTLSDGAAVRERFEDAFNHFPRLRERRRQRAGTLSGGEQSMLSFAMAMVLKPDCILLDEPSLGLAPKMTEMIFNTIVELNEAGITLVIVEQNVNVLFQIADYVYIFDNGRNRYDGTPESVNADEELLKLYMGVRAEV
jgi:branched-chain amino acid transport system ATP-binding protein